MDRASARQTDRGSFETAEQMMMLKLEHIFVGEGEFVVAAALGQRQQSLLRLHLAVYERIARLRLHRVNSRQPRFLHSSRAHTVTTIAAGTLVPSSVNGDIAIQWE